MFSHSGTRLLLVLNTPHLPTPEPCLEMVKDTKYRRFSEVYDFTWHDSELHIRCGSNEHTA